MEFIVFLLGILLTQLLWRPLPDYFLISLTGQMKKDIYLDLNLFPDNLLYCSLTNISYYCSRTWMIHFTMDNKHKPRSRNRKNIPEKGLRYSLTATFCWLLLIMFKILLKLNTLTSITFFFKFSIFFIEHYFLLNLLLPKIKIPVISKMINCFCTYHKISKFR